MKRLKTWILAALSSLVLLAPVAAFPAQGLAAPKDDICAGVVAAGGSCVQDDTPVTNTIRAVINILSFIVGIVAVIMVILGGFRYITSGGESSNISSAKNTILYALVGLVIVAVAQIIVRFVITKVPS